MNIAMELSYYPFIEKYRDEINQFIERLRGLKGLKVESNRFSTIITGDYQKVKDLVDKEIKQQLEQGQCLFIMKMTKMENS